jgi:hypothetical protein
VSLGVSSVNVSLKDCDLQIYIDGAWETLFHFDSVGNLFENKSITIENLTKDSLDKRIELEVF